MTFDLNVFSATYAQARATFLAEAAAAGLALTSYPHPLPGAQGEALALDVARAGHPRARRLLIVSSAVHGVEGFCGSGIQVHSLRQRGWCGKAWPHANDADAVAVLYLHAVNPWGFSHLRRVTHENVDLNRNFADFAAPPVNLGYRELHALLVPPQWPPSPQEVQALAQYVATQGMAALQAAVSSGQYEFADGLFYGGTAPTWSHRTLRQVLREHAAHAQQVAWLDLHTGLGPPGHGERIFSPVVADPGAYARANAWWGGQGRTTLTRHDDGSSASAKLSGTLAGCIDEELAQAQRTKITLEFGTVPPMQVLQAMRGEQWLFNHPETPSVVAAPLRQAMRDAFFVDSDDWKTQVLTQALEAMQQGMEGLRQPPH
jgi:Protein of unknown function (DUF2817)